MDKIAVKYAENEFCNNLLRPQSCIVKATWARKMAAKRSMNLF
jgi:hypothetical protein